MRAVVRLETFAEKHAAEHALKRAAGVKVIALEFDVKLSFDHKRSDTDIAAGAGQTLRWSTTGTSGGDTTNDGPWLGHAAGGSRMGLSVAQCREGDLPNMGVVGISNEISLRVPGRSQRCPCDSGPRLNRPARSTRLFISTAAPVARRCGGRDLVRHLAGEFELLLRSFGQHRDHQILKCIHANVQLYQLRVYQRRTIGSLFSSSL